MGQTDLVAGVGLVSGSIFFISPVCVAWSLHFPIQNIMFIENFIFWLYGT